MTGKAIKGHCRRHCCSFNLTCIAGKGLPPRRNVYAGPTTESQQTKMTLLVLTFKTPRWPHHATDGVMGGPGGPVVVAENGLVKRRLACPCCFCLDCAHRCTSRSARYLKSLASRSTVTDSGDRLPPVGSLHGFRAGSSCYPKSLSHSDGLSVVLQAPPVESHHAKYCLQHSSYGRGGLTTVIAEPSRPSYLRWLVTCSVHAHNFAMACIRIGPSPYCKHIWVKSLESHKKYLGESVPAVHLQNLAKVRRFWR